MRELPPAAAVFCYEQQASSQSAGSLTIGIPPPSTVLTEITGGLRDLWLNPKTPKTSRRKQDPGRADDGSKGVDHGENLYCTLKLFNSFSLQ